MQQLSLKRQTTDFFRSKKRKKRINAFVYSKFNYSPLRWHFSSNNCLKMLEKAKKRCLRLLLNERTKNYL